jgi:hypothetical protein
MSNNRAWSARERGIRPSGVGGGGGGSAPYMSIAKPGVMIEFELVASVAAVLVLLRKHALAELYAYCIGLSQVEDSKPILILQGRLGE